MLYLYLINNKNIYCRRQENTKLYELKKYKPIYNYEYLSDKKSINNTLIIKRTSKEVSER